MSDCVRRERQLQHYWWRLLALNENVNPGSVQEKWGPPRTPPASLFANITWLVSWLGGGIKSEKKGKKKLTWHWCFVSAWLEGSHWSFTGSLFAPPWCVVIVAVFPDALRMRSNCKMFTCKVRSVPRCPLCPTGLRRRFVLCQVTRPVCQVSIVSSYTV